MPPTTMNIVFKNFVAGNPSQFGCIHGCVEDVKHFTFPFGLQSVIPIENGPSKISGQQLQRVVATTLVFPALGMAAI